MRFIKAITLGLASLMAVKADKIYHCSKENTIALTFDDGPFEYTNELLDELKEAGIRATFFINGENYWKDLATSSSKQAVIARAYKEGHQIASHTWEHLIPEDREELKKSLKKVDDLVEKNTGHRPKYFRAPLGHCESDCIKYIEDLGYKVIQWDTDTNDWDYKDFPGLTPEEGAEKRVGMVKEFLTEEFGKKRENYLVLMHDVNKHTVRQIVPWIIKNGPLDKYKFVTVAECLGDSSENLEVKSIVAGNSTTTATNTTTTQVPVSTETPVRGTTGDNLNVNSGAISNSVNFLAFSALLLYSLYMVF